MIDKNRNEADRIFAESERAYRELRADVERELVRQHGAMAAALVPATLIPIVADPKMARDEFKIEMRPLVVKPAYSYGTFYIEPDPPKVDPLDVETDRWTLRSLLRVDEEGRREVAFIQRAEWTTAQRAAVSAHWSAQLRARVGASTAADKERERTRVVVDLEDWP